MIPPKGLRLRRMEEGDLDAVLAIERASDSAPHWERLDYRAALAEGENPALRRVALVAEWGGELAGFAIVRLVRLAEESEAELESIVVSLEKRGQGIGKALLAESLAHAKVAGARSMDLEVRASNTTAVRLYERFGFRETGRRRGYYRYPEDDAVLMRVSL
jgi:ribosomal-protein-alanine N-acetyltransferase